MKKERLDLFLVEQGLFESRSKAQAVIMAGEVLVDDQKIDKPGTMVKPDAKITLLGKKLPFVSRGGYKLNKALEVFPISLEGKTMADLGASTGGFTDCALQHGAKKVFAIDVGYGPVSYTHLDVYKRQFRVLPQLPCERLKKGKRVAKLPWVRFMPLPKVFIIQSVIFVQCTNLRKCFLLAASAPISIFEKN